MGGFRRFPGFLALAACALAAGCAGKAGAAAGVLPHKAVYDVALDEARGGQVMALDGKLQFEWRDACDGWVVNQHFVFRFTDRHGRMHWTNRRYLTWEAKDGRTFRFSIRTEGDGETIEYVEGEAVLHGDGSGGEVEYDHPSRYHATLPAGTLFPSFHFLDTLDDLGRPAGLASDVIFSGSEDTGLQRVTTFFGSSVSADPFAADGDPAGIPGREIRFAYFPYFDRGEHPDHEVELRVRANGVVDSFVIDHIDFSFAGELESLERLVPPEC